MLLAVGSNAGNIIIFMFYLDSIVVGEMYCSISKVFLFLTVVCIQQLIDMC